MGTTYRFFATNVDGTAAVLEGSRKHGVKRCIYVSSACVTFDGHDQLNVSEQVACPRRFVSVYLLTKKRAEDLVYAATDVQTIIVRPCVVFGPGDQCLSRLIDAARKQSLYQIGNERSWVDLTYVDNVVYALLLVLYSQKATGKIYTITSDEHIVLWDVLRIMLQRVELSPIVRSVPLPFALAVATLIENQALLMGISPVITRYAMYMLGCSRTYDISAARSDLGYQPVVSISEGMDRTIGAIKSYRQWES